MNTEDKRVIKTKRALKRALLDLMEKKPFKEITTSELCDSACVSKNTLYAHYDSKYDLLSGIIDELFENITAHLRENHANVSKTTKDDYQKDLIFILDYVHQHYGIFHILFSQDDDIYFSQRMTRMFAKHGFEWMEHISKKQNDFIEVDLVLTYSCVGQVAFLKRWILKYHAADKEHVKKIYTSTMINNVLLVSDIAIFPEKKVLSKA